MVTKRYKVSVLEEDTVEFDVPTELDFVPSNIYMESDDFASDNTQTNIEDSKGKRKAGIVASTSFTGSPKTYAVVFTTDYPDLNYKINIDGVDQRTWSYSNKTVSGFTIQTNANKALTGEVSWETVKVGE